MTNKREIRFISYPFQLNNEIILNIKFSPYADGKFKYQYMKEENKLVISENFLETFYQVVDDFAIQNNNEIETLEIKIIDRSKNQLKKYVNYQELLPLLDKNYIVIDLASFIYLEHYNSFYGLSSGFAFDIWLKKDNIYMKIHIDTITNYGKYKVRFFPKSLKLKSIKIADRYGPFNNNDDNESTSTDLNLDCIRTYIYRVEEMIEEICERKIINQELIVFMDEKKIIEDFDDSDLRKLSYSRFR